MQRMVAGIASEARSIEKSVDRRAMESRQKRAEVLRVARLQFIAKGYLATKMNDIAAAAGVSKRTLYMWHDDKAALFRACVVQGAQQFPAPEARSGVSAQDTLIAFALELATCLSEPIHSGMGRLLVREQHNFPELMAEARRTHETYLIAPLAAWLRENGLERPDETERAQAFIALTLARVHNELLLGASPLTRQAAQGHAALSVQLFLNGAAETLDISTPLIRSA